MPMINDYDLTLSLGKAEEEKRLAKAQARLLYLRLVCGGLMDSSQRLGPPLCVVMEGWDASGKGGLVTRMNATLDPRFCKVWSIAAPTREEAARHYLWRFWQRLPGNREIAVFDRTWYGRVLVERVDGFTPEPRWRDAYKEINEFEALLLADGVRLVKIFLHTTQAEQDKRLEERIRTPWKR